MSDLDFRALQLADTKIRQDIAKHQEQISGGVAQDFAQYKDRCGFIRGMQESLTIIEQVNKSFFEDRRP